MEPQQLNLTQLMTLRLMGRPCRHPELKPGLAMMCAQQGSGLQWPHLSSQGVTLDDFQGTCWLPCSLSMNQLPKLVSLRGLQKPWQPSCHPLPWPSWGV